jgi:cytochrome P450
MSPRRVLQEFEYGGVRFEPEERVFLMFGSANRDEQWFEDPDRFDVDRLAKGNLTFGAGPPFHPGAAASRSLVGDVALPMIFDRLDGCGWPTPRAGSSSAAGPSTGRSPFR